MPASVPARGRVEPRLRRVLRDAGWRCGLVELAALVAAQGGPWPVAAPLSTLAAAVTVERLVRHRGRGLLDAVLVGSGGLLVTLILLGLLLDLLPGGLGRPSC